jgi:glycosyl hydrolase family 42 (putative beta-galactosidase)
MPANGQADPANGHSSAAQIGSASRSDPSWSDYQIIIWQPQTPARLAGLARLGVTAGTIFGERGSLDLAKVGREAEPFLASHLRWYVENIATDFYAAYHHWQPDRPATWLFEAMKRLHRQEPTNIAAFIRTPSLCDPAWLRRIALRLAQHVRAYAPYRPLYYSLADEAGIADLTAAWDFDFAPASLAAMRVWLKQIYGTLAALNREWGTRFLDWDAVMPMTTDAALREPDENFATWADFKEWMDIAFARAVRTGTDAVHAADPSARAALEGAQPPGWGGYDYSHLAAALDVIEMSNAGNSVEVARSLVPRLITVTTSAVADPQQIHAIWHQLLLGGRGLILWDENNAFVAEDGAPTARGRVLGALAGELRSGLAAQLIASRPEIDPVAILYSPASQRTQWLLDRKSDGKSWVERGSETEYLDQNAVRVAGQRAAGILAHLGVQPRWVTRAMIEEGVLRTGHIRVLLLPHAIALSPAEAQQIRNFATAGGMVLTDSEPGLFDVHSRRLARPLLADLTGAGGPIVLMPELQQDAKAGDPASLTRMRQILEKAGTLPRFSLSTPGGELAADIDARVFCSGEATIIGLQRDGAERGDNIGGDTVVGFKEPVYVYDLRHPGPAQHAAQITLTLDAVGPALIAVAPTPLPELAVAGPAQARLGTAAEFTVTPVGATPAGKRIVHVEAIAPDGTATRALTANITVDGGHAAWQLPLALTDPVGNWTVRIIDVLAGRTMQHTLTVLAAAARPSRDQHH